MIHLNVFIFSNVDEKNKFTSNGFYLKRMLIKNFKIKNSFENNDNHYSG